MVLLPGWIRVAIVLVLLWQIVRLKKARRAAQAAHAAKAEFVANISHELRTPLNGIIGTLDVLSGTVLDPEQHEMVAIIRNSSESLLATINAVLDFSSIEAGKISLDRVAFSLKDSVNSVVAWLRPGAEAKSVRLEVEVSGNVPQFVMGDPARLRQILFNLLSNGIKFSEAGAVRLEVSLTCGSLAENALLFRVADTGTGIAPDIQARLFTPFMQADAASTRRHGGVGLGLATARRLVQLMGGAMGMESQPGKGSVFWFMLPLERAPAPEPVSPASTIEEPALPPQLKHGHVLVVDDNPINQLVAARAVTRLGYLAEVVSGGEQALDAMAQRAFEAVLLDCQMPGMDGYQTAAEIRRREAPGRRIPIIALTANTTEADVQKCLFSGMDDFLPKPVRIVALETTLEKWIHPGALKHSGVQPSFRAASNPANGLLNHQ